MVLLVLFEVKQSAESKGEKRLKMLDVMGRHTNGFYESDVLGESRRESGVGFNADSECMVRNAGAKTSNGCTQTHSGGCIRNEWKNLIKNCFIYPSTSTIRLG